MRRVSSKRAALLRTRGRMLRDTEADQQRCQWPDGCTERAVDPHEIVSRGRGGSITDSANIALLCRTHHRLITEHPDVGVAVGLVRRNTSSLRSRNVNAMVALMPTPRKPIAIRVSESADQWVTDRAAEHGVTRAVVIRAMLSVATAHANEVVGKIKSIAEIDRHSTPRS